MKTKLLLTLAAAALTGCASFQQVPAEVAQIKLDRVDSSRVFIARATFARDHGQLVLLGSVMRKVGVEDTTRTHLAVTLFDENGNMLREIPARFAPQDIPRGPKMSGWSEYRIPLAPVPADTSRIEIRACEDASGG